MDNKPILNEGAISPGLIAEYIEKVSVDKTSGAHSLFLGQVRDDTVNDRKVEAIEYSAYTEMVEKEAGNIRETVKAAFNDVKDIIIIHSTGIVRAGELSLFVLVSAGHRDQATRACRHVVEMIKDNYPVWKKELFDDDSHRWQQ
ncbi:MAG: molybdenum cofactor biosynthesis protein MoaE [Bacteroidales bacterium]|nr:molybdenum cofactor biosynthesis protein MoaE [Bacteroidales bacterium]